MFGSLSTNSDDPDQRSPLTESLARFSPQNESLRDSCSGENISLLSKPYLFTLTEL